MRLEEEDEKMVKIIGMNNLNISRKADQILFTISPSFYTTLSGAIIGAMVNLITGILFATGIQINLKLAILAILSLLISSGLFIYLSLLVERLHREAKDVDLLLGKIQDQRKNLYISFFVGFISIIVAIIFLYLSMRCLE